jgi:hypothetical protein
MKLSAIVVLAVLALGSWFVHRSRAKSAEYPYPAGDRVRFHLLTFHGVRVIETDMASTTRGAGPYAELFGLGQAVMTELRVTTQKAK